jgi:glucan phosphoethanolaminetransferase (alkaline phosphatase superfamily)
MPFALIAIGKSFWVSLKDNKGKILDISSICGVLIIELFILGVFKIYPFTGSRITLFIAPFIFFMIVQGIYLVRKIKLIFVPLLSVYIIFLSGVSYHLLWFYLNFYKK